MILGVALGLLVLLALSAFYSGAETGIYTVNRFRLRRLAHQGKPSARLLARLLADPVGLLVTFLLGSTVANYFITAIVTGLYEHAAVPSRHSPWTSPDVLATATVILPLFLLGDMLPKNWFRRNAERLSYPAAWLLAATKGLLFPAVWLLRGLARLIPTEHSPGAGLGIPRISRSLLDQLLAHGRETGELTAEQERLARNVLGSGERRVRELARPVGAGCCTPETESGTDPASRTLAVPAGEIAGKVLQRLISSRARLAVVLTPVASCQLPVASGQLPAAASLAPNPSPEGRGELATGVLRCREVLGYVRLFDLLAPGVQGKPVESLARPVPRLTAHTTFRQAFRTMQHECADLAIVEQPGSAAAGTGPGEGSGEPACPVLGVVRLPQLIEELLAAPAGVK